MSSLFQTRIDRRVLLRGVAGTAALALAGCSNAVGTNAGAELDARVDATHNYLIQNYPSAQALVQNARGVLYMPLMTEAALGVARIEFGADLLPLRLEQGGWTVDYSGWKPDPLTRLPMPSRINAQRGEDRVRLVVDRWGFE